MSIHTSLQPAPVCTCEQGLMCAAEGPGHALSAIQLRAASATPSKWQDATVSSISPTGWVVLAPVFGGADVPVWHHADLTQTLAIGDPVSLHALYNVLAAGRHRFNALVA
jgi:hypothetical protein